jgi:hypothetical protein
MLWGAALMAVVTAPHAAAEGVSTALSWSGLKDSHGVPVGAYFISTVDIGQAMQAQGTELGMDPSTWVPALASRLIVGLTYSWVAGALGACCGFLVFICALGIWLVKFALGTTWLVWLAAIATPVVANIHQVLNYLHVVPTALIICTTVGGVIALTKGYGRGIGIMVSGFVVIMLARMFLDDPVKHLASPDGVLGIGRWLGFSVGMGFANNGPIVAGGNDAQVDQLGSWMVDVLVRQNVQLINFGEVIDQRPGCGAAWDAALMNSTGAAGPVQAMKSCGASSAFAHAAHLSGESVGLFFLLNLVVMCVLLAICYIAAEVLRVGFKAFWNVMILVPAIAVAVAPGPQRRFAKRVALKAVVHGVEIMFATGGLGVLLIMMSHVVAGNIGGLAIEHPVLKLVVMLLLAGAGAWGFRHLLRGFGDGGLPVPTPMSFLRAGGPGVELLANQARNSVPREGREMATAFGPQGATGMGADGSGSRGPNGQSAPGRRAHPQVDGVSSGSNGPRPSSPPARSQGASTSTAVSAPAVGAPASSQWSGGGGLGGGGAAAPAPARTAAPAAGHAAAGGASKAAMVAAPELAAASVVAQQASSTAQRRREAPGRTSAPTPKGDLPPGLGLTDQAGAAERPPRPAPGRTPGTPQE